MHVPLVIAGPGIAHGKSEALVYLMDLFPTFAEIGGGKIPEDVEGKSLLSIAQGKQHRCEVYCIRLTEIANARYVMIAGSLCATRWSIRRSCSI